MSERTSGLDESELSDLIGEIYDCVIDPQQWEPTLDRIRDLLDCANGMLAVYDDLGKSFRLQTVVGVEPHWLARMAEYGDDVAQLYALVPDLLTRPLDEPFIGRREVRDETWFANRYYREWAAPQGLVDTAMLHMMRGPGRFAEIGLGRHESFGLITDREVRLLRLLAPHLRRAVTIADLIDMKVIHSATLGRTLDLVPAGVVLVAEDAIILHANRTAARMIDEGSPIASVAGRLSVADAANTRQLREVVAAAARNEARIGGAGIGMALTGHVGPPATAHVLPIAEGMLRSHLLPRGAAAVFVASEGAQTPMNLQAVADIYGLSGAEARMLGRLMQGDTVSEAAAALCIAQSTAKTHLSRLFAKTGTQRQASLIALINKLVPPVVPPGGGDG